MDTNQVKSGKEILDDFFKEISTIKDVDKGIAEALVSLYEQGKFSDINIKNALQILRDQDGNEN